MIVRRCAAFAMMTAACGTASLTQNKRGVEPQAPVVVQASLDGRVLLQETAATATAAGAGPMSVVVTGEAVERERLGAFVEVPAESCLLAYGRASGSVDDLDLAAFSDEGNPVAVDDAPDARPTLLVCPPHPGRVYLAAIAASGEGLVVVGAQLVTGARGAEVGKATHARGARSPASRAADAWPGLDDRTRRHRETIGGKWETFRKVALAVDARTPAELAFPVEADACTDALVVPDDDVAALDVEALDARGRVMARGAGVGRDRALTVCSAVAASASLVVRPHVGQGLVAVVLSRGAGDVARQLSSRPDVILSGAPLPLEAAKAGREKALNRAGYGGIASSFYGVLPVSPPRSVKVDLPPHACSRVEVVAGEPTALLSLEAWTDTGELIAAGEGATLVALFSCGAPSLRLDLTARGRGGPFDVSVRPEPWADPAFLVHPVAAARMLTRMAEGVDALLEGSALTARALTLDAGRESVWNSVVPPGKCLHLGAGGSGPGAGLVARMFDAATGDEVDRSHAADAVLLRGCASDGAPRGLRISVSVTAGKLDVVVGERLTG